MCVHNYGKIARIQLKIIEFWNTLMSTPKQPLSEA